jgi:hypothetical protein
MIIGRTPRENNCKRLMNIYSFKKIYMDREKSSWKVGGPPEKSPPTNLMKVFKDPS